MVADLPRAIEAAAETLFAALNTYFPQKTDWDLQEVNATFHVAHSLMRAGYQVFPETRLSSGGRRADLVAIKSPIDSRTKPHIVLVESKRIYGNKNAASIVADIDRLADVRWERPIDGERDALISVVVLVATHKESVIEWWNTPTSTLPFKTRDTETERAWDRLGDRLSLALKDYKRAIITVAGEEKTTALLYAIWSAKVEGDGLRLSAPVR
jgi:hypothetical protein